MSAARWRRLRLVTKSVMSTDDEVAPGTSRKAGGRILAGGLALVTVSSLLLFASIQDRSDKAVRSSGLNEQEIKQLRDLLNQRTSQRDREQEEIQTQLDKQARILCLAIADFRSRARSTESKRTLDDAMRALKCSKVIKEDSTSRAEYTRTPLDETGKKVSTQTVTATKTVSIRPTSTPTVRPTSTSVPTEPLLYPLCEVVEILCINPPRTTLPLP